MAATSLMLGFKRERESVLRHLACPRLQVACVAAGPRTRLNPLYTEGLERLRRRLGSKVSLGFWEWRCPYHFDGARNHAEAGERAGSGPSSL